MIKLIATDVDGTLVKDGTMQIDPEYMTVIKELVQKGIILLSAPADSSSVSGSCLHRSKISCSTSRTAARSCAPHRRF